MPYFSFPGSGLVSGESGRWRVKSRIKGPHIPVILKTVLHPPNTINCTIPAAEDSGLSKHRDD